MRSLLLLFCWFLTTSISVLLAQPFSCKTLLDKEKEVGYPVTDEHYKMLESIFQRINSRVTFVADPTEQQATDICLAMSDVLEKDFGITYEIINLLYEGLEKRKLDCNFYSILFYDILNKQYGYEVAPVVAPGHMFFRWHLKNGSFFNYETTAKQVYEDQQYIELFTISKQAITNKIYMSDISDDQIWATNLVEMASIMPIDKLPEKEKLCNQAIALDNKCIIAKLLAGSNYIDSKKYEDAVTYYDMLYHLDSLDYSIVMRIGMLYSELDNHSMATDYYSKAIKINPSNPELYTIRSKEYLRVNNVDKAMEDFELASNLLTADNLFTLLFNYIMLTNLEQEIMEKYLEINNK